jgi:hypothetical protein
LPPDSIAIDRGLLAHLSADAALKALLPDGVFWSVGPPSARRFALVSLVVTLDVAEFGRRAYEDVVYLVKAVVLVSTGGDAGGAAARIDALLEDGTFPIDGYALMSSVRLERLRETETDDADPSIRWYHWGGRYRVQATPLASGVDR